jgi:hypothetical protein
MSKNRWNLVHQEVGYNQGVSAAELMPYRQVKRDTASLLRLAEKLDVRMF